MNLWLIYALLSAACASFVAIFGKIGMKDVDSDVATGLRSVAQAIFVIIVCTAIGSWSKIGSVHGKAYLMSALAGIAGGASWLFYFRALSLGDVAKVGPIDKLSMPLSILLAILILREVPPAWPNWIGIAMVSIGAMIAAHKF